MAVGARRQSSPCLAAVLTFTAMLVAAAPGHARILAESRFDTDADGWVAKDLPYPSPGTPPAPIGTFAPVYHNAGGNPGGYLSLTDPTANTWYWYAPPKFLGDMSGAYGGALSFDLVLTGTGPPDHRRAADGGPQPVHDSVRASSVSIASIRALMRAWFARRRAL